MPRAELRWWSWISGIALCLPAGYCIDF